MKNTTRRLLSEYIGRIVLSFFILSLSFFSLNIKAEEETVCAQVQLTIKQEVSFERQGFEAHMKINNGVVGVPITDVAVTVLFEDEEHQPVTVTSDPNATGDDIRFFFRLDDDKTNITGDVSTGTAEVAGGTSSDIYWLIIPSHDVNNTSPKGKLYFIGAELTYKIGGEENKTVVSPDFIYVKPTPLLTVDYFLPKVCIGDDPNTSLIEASEPFDLGVRVRNDGYGPANSFNIESAQPKIINNDLGLLIGFKILGSEIDGVKSESVMKINFGDIEALSVSSASWEMETTLAGAIQDFTADFTHADALGGKVTSLIEQINTHYLAHRVLSDIPDSDSILEFLTVDGTTYALYNSEVAEPQAVANQSSGASLTVESSSPTQETAEFNFSQTSGYAFAKVADPFNGQRIIKSVIRSDGKRMPVNNRWFSREPTVNGGWSYYLNIFDYNTSGKYIFSFDSIANTPFAPVLQYITDKVVAPEKQVSFIVETSDQNGDDITVSAATLPEGATFAYSEIRGALTIYIFDWIPTAEQVGEWPITFTASDGALSSQRTATITVGNGGYAVTVTNGSGSGSYPPNADVEILAAPATTGQTFDKWIGDTAAVVDVNSETTTVTMPSANVALTATYRELPKYYLTVVNGTGSGDYYEGEKVVISANQPPEGKVFAEWESVAPGALANTTSLTTELTMPSSVFQVKASYANPGITFYSWNVNNALFRQEVRDALVALKPDTIFLIQAGTESDLNQLVADLSASTPFTYNLFQNGTDGVNKMALISRFPFQNQEVIEHADLQNPILKSEFVIEEKLFTIFGVDSRDPNDPTLYSTEANQILSQITTLSQNENTIILGDLNTRSVSDGAINALDDTDANNSNKGYATLGYAYPNIYFPSALADVGYIDTWRSVFPNAAVKPTKNREEDEGLISNMVERVSYCFISADLSTSLLDAGINAEFNNSISQDKPVWIRMATDGNEFTFGGERASVTPTITGSSLGAENVYIDVSFNQGVFGNETASLPLTINNFEVTFNAHISGRALDCAVSSVKKTDNIIEADASVLTGGEITVRLFLNMTGYPIGTETIKVHLAGANATAQNKTPLHIYNSSGISDIWTRISEEVPFASTIRTNYHILNEVEIPVEAVADNYQTDEDVILTTTAENSIIVNDIAEDATVVLDTTVPEETGLLELAENGIFTYTPAPNFNGVTTFSYHLTKLGAVSETVVVTITVNSVNDAPVAIASNVVTDEDNALAITLAGTDIENGDTVTYSLTTQPTHGVVTGTAPNLTYTPNANFNGNDSFTFKVNDGNLDSVVNATVAITVNAINDIPIADAKAITTNEDSSVAVVLTGSDIDGDTLTYSVVDQPSNGTLSGTVPNLTYTPNADYNGADSFTFKVNDGTVDSLVANIAITINPVDDAPVVANAITNITVDEDAIAQVIDLNNIFNDIDNDNAQIAKSVLSNSNEEVLTPTILNNNLTLAFTANAFGEATIVVRGTSNGKTVDTNFTVTVNSINDAPVAVNDTATTDEDNAVVVSALANDTDIENDTLSIVSVTQGLDGAVTIDGINVVYTPTDNYNGNDTFTYTISDGNGGTATANVAVTINAVNDIPIAVAQAITTDEDTALAIVLTGSDIDNDTISYILVTQPANGVLTGTAPNLTYTPNVDYNGADSFTFKVNDGTVDSSIANIAITITPVDDAPVVANAIANVIVDEDVAVQTIDLSNVFNDIDNDNVQITKSIVSNSNEQLLTASISGNNLTLTLVANAFGTSTVTIRGTSNSQTIDTRFTVTVNSVNDVPVAVNDTAVVDEDNAVTINVLTNDSDVDNDTLSLTSVTQGTNGAVAIAGITVTYTPVANFNGTDLFTYTISDGNGGTATANVAVTINAVNDAPVAAAQAITTDEDTALAITLTGTDIDEDTLTYIVVSQPANGVLTGTAPNLTYTPNADYNGADSFTFKVNDGTVDSVIANIAITITPVDDAPVVANAITNMTVDEDAVVEVIDLNNVFNDIDNENSQIVKSILSNSNEELLTPTILNNNLTLTLVANAFGTSTVTIRGTSNSQTIDTRFTVTVNSVNDVPVAVNDTVVVDEDNAVTINVLTNDSDVDNDTLSLTSVTQGTNGTVMIVGTTVNYIPNINFNGTDSFTYTINDGNDETATANVEVTINAVNDAPVAVDDIALISVGANPEYIIIDNLSATLNPNPSNSLNNQFVITTAGEVLDLDGLADKEAGYEYNGPVTDIIIKAKGNNQSLNINNEYLKLSTNPTFTFLGNMTARIWNSKGKVSKANWWIEFTGEQIAIFPVPEGADALQGPAVNIDLISNDTDIDHDQLSIVAVMEPANGRVEAHPDGTVTYTANPLFTGNDSFEYTVSDGNGGTDTGTVTIGVISEKDNTESEFENIAGNLNINPSMDDEDSFEMKTDSGVAIDINTLSTEGSAYEYIGAVTEIKLKALEQGATVSINGTSVQLNPDLKYVIKGTINAVLKNTKSNDVWSVAKDHWWIEITGQNITISLD